MKTTKWVGRQRKKDERTFQGLMSEQIKVLEEHIENQDQRIIDLLEGNAKKRELIRELRADVARVKHSLETLIKGLT